MPQTAKLSRRFYERFGDEVTNELVDWLNSVDASYQASVREQNEVLFARFEARLEQCLAELITPLSAQVAQLAGQVAQLTVQVAQLASQMTQLELRVEARIEGLRADQARFEARILRWTIGLWTSTMLAFLALLVAVLRAR